MSNTNITLPQSQSLWWASSRLAYAIYYYFGLDPWGVTCREDSNDQVSQQILRKSNLV